MQRIREGFTEGNDKPFPGPVEVDETCMGGRKKNMSKAKRREVRGRGPAGKAMVVGAKDRATNNDRKAEASWPSTKGDFPRSTLRQRMPRGPYSPQSSQQIHLGETPRSPSPKSRLASPLYSPEA